MRKGFTLMELIIVVIIVAILAAIGLPQFFKVAERGRAAEGVSALGALKNAQIRYAAEHGRTTNSLNDLDYESTALKFFNAPGVSGNVNPRTNGGDEVANIQRNSTSNPFDTYTLKITADGTISCGTTAGCKAAGY